MTLFILLYPKSSFLSSLASVILIFVRYLHNIKVSSYNFGSCFTTFYNSSSLIYVRLKSNIFSRWQLLKLRFLIYVHSDKHNDSSFVSYLVKFANISAFILVSTKLNLLRCLKLDILNYFSSWQEYKPSYYKFGRLIANSSS